jgi:uncharacterized protein
MNCPHCNVTLAVAERQGVEIDHCPRCRGVWLDRGELDKIVERYAAYEGRSPRYPGEQRVHHGEHHGHRRKSFWQELFD